MKPAVVDAVGSFYRALQPELALETSSQFIINRLIRKFSGYSFHKGIVSDLTLSIMCLSELSKLFPKLFNKNKELKKLLNIYNAKYKKFAKRK